MNQAPIPLSCMIHHPGLEQNFYNIYRMEHGPLRCFGHGWCWGTPQQGRQPIMCRLRDLQGVS
ncbi:Hypothetical protein SMAX5B_019772 [Scophthalmus maximus]|uniref:Uncharacterized protein n=1 Tax=Scophthalmus maximus TaxID=52904 RepID=A0A2U9BRV9_SCOMX|nr:Hypothetical protein SMAX5B_019772 [Scophthalmus maximus]